MMSGERIERIRRRRALLAGEAVPALPEDQFAETPDWMYEAALDADYEARERGEIDEFGEARHGYWRTIYRFGLCKLTRGCKRRHAGIYVRQVTRDGQRVDAPGELPTLWIYGPLKEIPVPVIREKELQMEIELLPRDLAASLEYPVPLYEGLGTIQVKCSCGKTITYRKDALQKLVQVLAVRP